MRHASAIRGAGRCAKGVALMAVAAACSDSVVSFGEQGELCLLAAPDLATRGLSNGQVQTFVPGQTVTVSVAMTVYACTEDLQGSCSVEQIDATTLQVHSQGSYRSADNRADCVNDPSVVVAQCSTPPLAAGAYTVKLSYEQALLTIPSTTSGKICVGPGQPCATTGTEFAFSEPGLPAHGTTVTHLSATGSCTAACVGDASGNLCARVRATPIAEGPCTIDVETTDGRVFEAHAVTATYPRGSQCYETYLVPQMPFALVSDGGVPDAGATEAAADAADPDASAE
jgi:hypothetical protein